MKNKMIIAVMFSACTLMVQTAQATLSASNLKKAHQEIASGGVTQLNSKCKAVVLAEEIERGEEYTVVIDKVKAQERCIDAERTAATAEMMAALVHQKYASASKSQKRTLLRAMSNAAIAKQKESSAILLTTQKEAYSVVRPFWMDAEMKKIRKQTKNCLGMFQSEEGAAFYGASTLAQKFNGGQKCLTQQAVAVQSLKAGPFNLAQEADPHFFAKVLKTEASRLFKTP